MATLHFKPQNTFGSQSSQAFQTRGQKPGLIKKTHSIKPQLAFDTVHFGSKPTEEQPEAPSQPGQTEQAQAPAKTSGRLKRLGNGLWQAIKISGKALAFPFVWTGKLALKPFEKLQPRQRLKNAVENAIGYPRHQKLVKAGIWAGATFAIGCIPIPGFQALIAAAPVTFLTTLLVDFSVGFFDGLTKDPEKMRAFLDSWKQQA
jgi:hypothetical protein